MASLPRIEKLARSGELELVVLLPEGREPDGTWSEVTISVTDSKGDQHDFPLTPSELKNKKRLRKLAHLFRISGAILVDDYDMLGEDAIGLPDSPDFPGE